MNADATPRPWSLGATPLMGRSLARQRFAVYHTVAKRPKRPRDSNVLAASLRQRIADAPDRDYAYHTDGPRRKSVESRA